MKRIASFSIDHTVLVPGLYLGRQDGDIVAFDLRFKKPNTGDLLSNAEMHSLEHLMATILRNSPEKEAVVYFGPMGCQTGFYFLFDGTLLTSPVECGNYVNLDLDAAKACCAWYADLIKDWTEAKLAYPKA